MRRHCAGALLSVYLLLPGAVLGAAQLAPERAPPSPCHHNVPDITLSLEELQQRADDGDHLAPCLIGLKYLLGRGVEADADKAAKWLRQGVKGLSSKNPGAVASSYYLGQMTIRGQGGIAADPIAGTAMVRRAAQLGHLPAQLHIGVLLAQGLGVDADPEAAISWYRRAAERDYAPAMFYLAGANERGIGTEKDLKKAAEWNRRAAELGLPEGQFNTGMNYLHGQGVEQNPATAVQWFQEAARRGLQQAEDMLIQLGRGKVSATATVAEAKGSGDASVTATAHTAKPTTTPPPPPQSIKPHRSAPAMPPTHPAPPQRHDAELLQQALKLLQADEQDRKSADASAFQILSTLAAKDQPAPQFYLGSLHQLGRGTVADPRMAIYWYQRAAWAGVPEAQHGLAMLFAAGTGHPQNSLEAYIWLSLAVAIKDDDKWREQRDAIATQLSPATREQLQLESQRRWHKILGDDTEQAAAQPPAAELSQ